MQIGQITMDKYPQISLQQDNLFSVPAVIVSVQSVHDVCVTALDVVEVL